MKLGGIGAHEGVDRRMVDVVLSQKKKDATSLPVNEDNVQISDNKLDVNIIKPVKTANKKIDITTIPIGVEIEMGGFPWDKLERSIKSTNIPITVESGHSDQGWDPKKSWRLNYDVTVSNVMGTGGEMSSRIMMLKGGALDEMRQVYKLMKECGGFVSQKASLHVHAGAKDIGLSAKALANLVKMELAYETIIYRIAQNGQPTHRDDGNKDVYGKSAKYCKPLSIEPIFPFLHADSIEDAKNKWYEAMPNGTNFRNLKVFSQGHRDHPSRFHGLNLNSYFYRGTVEFRFPNSSDNVEDYVANTLFYLSMVKAAEEQDWDLDEVHPWDQEKDKPVPEKRINEFLDRVVGNGELKQYLINLFVKSGGKITKESSPFEPMKAMANNLISKNYKFIMQDTPLTSAEAVEAVKSCHFSVTGVNPKGEKNKIGDSATLKSYLTKELLVSSKNKNEFAAVFNVMDQKMRESLGLCSRIEKGGVKFLTSRGENMPGEKGLIPYLTLDAGESIQVVLPGETVLLKIKRLPDLELLERMISKKNLEANIQSGLEMCNRIVSAGAKLFTTDGKEIIGRGGVLQYGLLSAGIPLQVVLPGESLSLKVEQLSDLELMDRMISGTGLDAKDKNGIELCSRMVNNGTSFLTAEGVKMTAARGILPHTLLKYGNSIQVVLPGESVALKVGRLSDVEFLDRMITGESLDPKEEASLKHCNALLNTGSKFFTSDGKAITAKNGVLAYVLLIAGTPIQIVLPGESAPMQVANLSELEDIYALLQGEGMVRSKEQQEKLRIFTKLQKINGIEFFSGSKLVDNKPLQYKNRASLMLRLGNEPIVVKLPQKVRWGTWWHNEVTVNNVNDLRTLFERTWEMWGVKDEEKKAV